VLAIRLDLMGDVIFTLPALEAMREAMPQARISFLALPYTGELLVGHPAVDEVISVDVNRWRRPGHWITGTAVGELSSAISALRQRRFDLAISFYGRVGAAAALLSGAGFLVGYGEEGFAHGFDLPVPGRRYLVRKHEVEYCVELVRATGAKEEPRLPRLRPDPRSSERVGLLLSGLGLREGERLAALHPGALSSTAKQWLPDRWAAVADRIQTELGFRVLLVGSASELPLVGELTRLMRTRPVVLAGKTSVRELVALISRCSLFIGGDSGPLHVAGAVGVPSVSIYGPTDPLVTGPLGSPHRVLRAGVPCSPCYDPMRPVACRRPKYECMLGVSADEVFEAVAEMMAGK